MVMWRESGMTKRSMTFWLRHHLRLVILEIVPFLLFPSDRFHVQSRHFNSKLISDSSEQLLTHFCRPRESTTSAEKKRPHRRHLERTTKPVIELNSPFPLGGVVTTVGHLTAWFVFKVNAVAFVWHFFPFSWFSYLTNSKIFSYTNSVLRVICLLVLEVITFSRNYT